MDRLIALFLTAKQADGRAPITLSGYRRALGADFVTVFPDVASLNRAALREYVAALRATGKAPGTVNIALRYLRAFLRWLHTEGHTPENFALVIATPRQTIRWEELMTPDDLKRLIAACTGDQALRDRAIILFLVDTGLRRGEFVPLQRDQIRFDDDGAWLHFNAPKNGNKRYAVLGRAASAALRAYLDSRKDANPALWVSDDGAALGYHAIYHMLRRRAEQAGIEPEKVHPHAFRKIFATWWIQNGGDEQRLMTLGGWSGPEMLRIYCRLGKLDTLRQGHRDYSPVDGVL